MLNQIRRYRTFSLWIAAILLLSVVGMHLDVHYCQGKLAGVSLVSPDTSTCEMQPSVTAKGCCQSLHEDNDCCEDVESISALDYDGLAYSVLQFKESNTSHTPILPYLSLLISVTAPEIINLEIDPPDELSMLGIQKRILFQSFLC